MRASENVFEHKVGKLTAKYETHLEAQDLKKSKKHMTKNVVDRLVEDLILESMAKGDFDNLKGTGKPLPERVVYNPYEDFTTHKMNEILVEGGFAPEWITLQKDINTMKNEIRNSLQVKCSQIVGEARKAEASRTRWKRYIEDTAFDDDVTNLNKSIDKYNLMVPTMNSQMFHFNIFKEANKIFERTVNGEIPTPEPESPRKLAKKKVQPVVENSESAWDFLRNQLKSYFKPNS